MIEVVAKLPHGHVFLSGETLECSVTFNHPPSPNHTVSQSHTDVFESLAWASAQIHCHCFTDSKVAKDRGGENVSNFPGTALSVNINEHAKVEVATKPKILFCDLRLSPGQSKTYIYREKIPNDSPPSYRGQLVKYSYKITIGTQRVNSQIKLLRVPIRVLPLCETLMNDAVAMCNDTTEELTPANPFLEIRKKESPLEIALQSLQNITARRNPNSYMITNTWGKVARFCLFKPSYKLGEDIIGTFDFTVATVSCIQVSVSLQCEEKTNLENSEEPKTRIITFGNFHDVCLGYDYTQLILPIPLHVTPDFSTKLVSLTWRLHFEFVTSTNKGLLLPSKEDTEWQAPSEVTVETMVWSLPIKLYSTIPTHVAQGVLSNNVHKLTIR
ncbi:RAB6A-GEF complex partner protein 2 [Diorhabda sublineata]|uniref:RAB6A-GEF complex partner protein 2 n=1 Tax=Diorhabda sublineata TaxID=1163346 RepID=UPI0024E1952F|nr:RAB6A-GEF complex partner protein 2 [Diorhabda sublineata]